MKDSILPMDNPQQRQARRDGNAATLPWVVLAVPGARVEARTGSGSMAPILRDQQVDLAVPPMGCQVASRYSRRVGAEAQAW